MENRKILFTAPGKAELVSCEMPRIAPDEVLIETDYTAISAGTERANLLDMPQCDAPVAQTTGLQRQRPHRGSGGGRAGFPRGAARADGPSRAIALMRKREFQANGDGFYPVPEDVDPLEAAFVVVGSMGVQGARKTRLQMGEAAMVTGLGILACLPCRAWSAWVRRL